MEHGGIIDKSTHDVETEHANAGRDPQASAKRPNNTIIPARPLRGMRTAGHLRPGRHGIHLLIAH